MFEKKKRILIVDDEPALRMGLKIRLEAHNYEVLEAADGQTALDKAKGENPDLIILDVMLPGIDGYKICRMLKFDDNYKNIPIIMLTARAQAQDEQTSKQVGADAYLTKPPKADILLGKISELLKK